MKFYDEEKLLKLRNVLIVVVLALWALLLFFKVYDNFAKSIRMVTSTIFPFILSFVIVYCLMPFIDMISEKDRNGNDVKNSKLDELEKNGLNADYVTITDDKIKFLLINGDNGNNERQLEIVKNILKEEILYEI